MGYYPEFAKLLDQYLTDRDRSGAWLAQRLAVNPATVTRWRNGDSRPNKPEIVIQLADLLGVHGEERQRLLVAAGYGYIEAAPQADAERLDRPEPVKAESDSKDETEQAVGERLADRAPQPVETIPELAQSQPGDVEWRRRLRKSVAKIVVNPMIQLGFGVVAALIMGVSLWIAAGQPGFHSEAATVQRFAIDEWKNLSPAPSAYDALLLEETRRILYEKLSQAPTLQGVSWRSPQVSEEMQADLDIWIEGNYRKLSQVELVANIYGKQGEFLTTVAVQGKVEGTAGEAKICILDLQTQLITATLAALAITVEPEVATAVENVPTKDCEALQLNNEAATLVMQGNLPSAQTLLEQAKTIDPDYADVHNNLGQLFYRQKAWVRAIEAYQRALDIQPRNAIYHYNVGLAYERLGDFAAAVKAYQAALTHDPLYEQAFNNLGFTYLLIDEPGKAAEILQQGLRLNEKAPYLRKNLGRAYLDLGDRAGAIRELSLAIDLFQGGIYAEALYYLALAYQQAGDLPAACRTLLRYAPVANADEATRATQAEANFSAWSCDKQVRQP